MPVAVVDPPRTAGIGLNELILDGGLENGLHQVVGMGYGGELAGGDLLGVPGRTAAVVISASGVSDQEARRPVSINLGSRP